MTRRQLDLLKFYRDYSRQNGTGPSRDEVKAALGIKSNSFIDFSLNSLAAKGFILRPAGRYRAVEVIRMPEGAQ